MNQVSYFYWIKVLMLFNIGIITRGDNSKEVQTIDESTNSTNIHVAPAMKIKNNTVKAWSAPFNISDISRAENYAPYSAATISKLVRNYHDHSSTQDPFNEVYYTQKRIGDNVWFNIERIAPFKIFVNWAINISRIMDRYDLSGKSMFNKYIQKPNISCSPETSFALSEEIIMTDDKNIRAKLDPFINQWIRKNRKTPTESICNKFRGLTCNPYKRICECESKDNSVHYVTYTRTEQDKLGQYRDGCYVKPWNKCSHLSLDNNIPAEYKSFHAHPDNMKQFLIRLATPLPRVPRCEKGSFCVDMIINIKKPICWCASSNSKDCYNSRALPLLQQFLGIRKRFHQMIIPEKDKKIKCSLDATLDENLQEIKELLEDVQMNHRMILRLMREVIAKAGRGVRICDFRKGLACDPFKKTCTYRTGCGPGRVLDQEGGFKQCRVNNGYPCPLMGMECVRGAGCKDFGQGRHCHCLFDKYGDLCRYSDAAFFSSTLQSRVSGFVGYHFTNLQELANHILAPVETLMTLKYGEKCNSSLDRYAMAIVRYMGGVRLVYLDQLDDAIFAIQYLVEKDEQLCDYRRFLSCTTKSKCEPMIPDVAKYHVVNMPDLPGGVKIYLSLRPMARCYGPGNFSNIPPVRFDNHENYESDYNTNMISKKQS